MTSSWVWPVVSGSSGTPPFCWCIHPDPWRDRDLLDPHHMVPLQKQTVDQSWSDQTDPPDPCIPPGPSHHCDGAPGPGRWCPCVPGTLTSLLQGSVVTGRIQRLCVPEQHLRGHWNHVHKTDPGSNLLDCCSSWWRRQSDQDAVQRVVIALFPTPAWSPCRIRPPSPTCTAVPVMRIHRSTSSPKTVSPQVLWLWFAPPASWMDSAWSLPVSVLF